MSVIKEVPVYLSKQFMDSLLLFEFPNRPKENPIKASSISECKYKPKFQYAELSISLDTKSANYEPHRGKDLSRDAPEQFPRGQYDRQLFRSLPRAQTGVGQVQNCFAVARFHSNRLTICPVPSSGRLTMQPVLEHLDSKTADAGVGPLPEEAADSAKAVTLRFARQETPEARQRREQSYRVCQRALEQEAWLKCTWLSEVDASLNRNSNEFLMGVADALARVAMETDDGQTEIESATIGKEAGKKLAYANEAGGSVEHYLRRLCPPVSTVSAADDHAASVADRGAPSVSLARLKAMPCDERLRALFKSACVLRWTQLVDLLKQCGMTHAQLTESLPQIHGHLAELACLVHGQWVVKSEILYPAGTVSMYSGVPAEVLCRGRDYILCRFVQGRTVTRKEVASLVKMPSEEISQILARISRVVRPTGDSAHHHHHHHQHQQQQRAPKMRLAFVMDEDTEYTRRNPDIVKKARYYWEAKWKLISEQLKLDKASRPFRTASISLDPASAAAARRRSRTRSARYSTSSEVVSDSSLSSSAASSTASGRRQNSPTRGGRGSRRLYSRRHCVSMCDGADGSSVGSAGQQPPPPGADRSRSPSPSVGRLLTPKQSDDRSAIAESLSSADRNSSKLELSIRAFLLTKLQDRMVAGLEELIRFYRAEVMQPVVAESSSGAGSESTSAHALPVSEEACRLLFDSAAESANLVILQGASGCRLYAYNSSDTGQTHSGHRRELLAALKSGNAQVTLAQLRTRFESAQLEPLSEAALKNLVRDYCVFRGKAYYAKGYQHGP